VWLWPSVPTGWQRLDILVTTNPSTKYTIDASNNGLTPTTPPPHGGKVSGTSRGNANDRVTLDQTQATANNMIDLGAQQDNSELATLREGADIVTINHADVTNDGVVNATDVPLRPTLTLAVQGTSMSQLTSTGGALGKMSFTDTFKNVEIVDLTAAATSDRFDDVLDVSAAGGVTVNYSTANAVGKSRGNAPVTTVAQLVPIRWTRRHAPNGAPGSEPSRSTASPARERDRSASADRVIIGNVMQAVSILPTTALSSPCGTW
jgi:hypothetical protein